MSPKELKHKIQEQFTKCEQNLIKAVEHTKNRIIDYLEQFQKEQLNHINKSFFGIVSQVKLKDHNPELEHHLLSSILSMESQFPEFQKILKAQVRIPVRENLRKIEFQMPQVEILPVSFNLVHKKSLTSTYAALSENQAINCVTSLPQSRLSVAVLTKIKILDIHQEKILASIVAHTEPITSLNCFTLTIRQRIEESLADKMKKQGQSNRKGSMNKAIKSKNSQQQQIQEVSNIQSRSFSDEVVQKVEEKWQYQSESVLISTSLDKRCQIIGLRSFNLLKTLRFLNQTHSSLQLSAEEILIQFTDGFSIFRDLEQKVGEFKYNQNIIRCAYSKQLQIIVLHSKNKITFVNKNSLKMISSFVAPSDSFFMKIIGRSVLIVHPCGIQTQKIPSGDIDKQKTLNFPCQICSVTDMQDEKHLAFITMKNEVSIFDYIDMKLKSNLSLGGKSGTRSITYLNDGQHFAVNTVDNKIKLWAFSKD